MMLVRTRMKSALTPQVRRPGPWHVVHEFGQTWCGKRPGRQVGAQHLRVERPTGVAFVGIPGLPEGRYCSDCQRALLEDRPRAFRGKR